MVGTYYVRCCRAELAIAVPQGKSVFLMFVQRGNGRMFPDAVRIFRLGKSWVAASDEYMRR